ncbi:MAG: fatty acid cis/trans isomerase [Gammaproteobacteria bacterium]
MHKKIYNNKALLAFIIVILTLVLFYNFYVISSLSHKEFKTVTPEIVSAALETPVNYQQQIKPILERRCVVCHGCYDAPCQLKLSSPEGLERGATTERIYDLQRINSTAPTRLFIDAKSTAEWRKHGFTSILNEGKKTPENNLNNSVLYRLLNLKQKNPQPVGGKLPEKFTLDLDREETCPTLKSVDKFAKDHPLWGMPYAMPNLQKSEYQTLVSWIAQGSPSSKANAVSFVVQAQIKQWELFFNETSNKQQLVSRYLYEHLFHAHIHFKDSPQREFFRLVRSTTPSGEAINEIATLRPNDDPGGKFYYRLLAYPSSIVIKNHIVYELSNKKMQRFRELFLTPDYTVSKLPVYDRGVTSNPFIVFDAIPAKSRYRFMLDNAHFFIEGFIKGPVCRGQIALNVIEDQFWVVFFNPDQPIISNNSKFIEKMSAELQLPADYDTNFDLLRIWTEYWKGQRRYMEHKQAWFKKIGTHKIKHAMNYIWDGEGSNPNAALTVFRHFDSGSVAYGLVGSEPETTWVIDYPLLERIHYLLVADFNIYGNIAHRMSTRIYMDFLRMEGEDSFLAFLPVSSRKAIRDKWYVGQRSQIQELFSAPQEWLSTESVAGYQTENPQHELYQRIKGRFSDITEHTSAMNHCGQIKCSNSTAKTAAKRVERAMSKIAQLQGQQLHAFPDIAFVRVISAKPEDNVAYTLIRNKAYKNVTSFLADEHERDRADINRDTMTVVNWLEGSYPNLFFVVALSDVENFSERCAAIRNSKDYEKFVDRYGVRRTNSLFWETADWFQDEIKKNKPVLSGLFDLNRFHNR